MRRIRDEKKWGEIHPSRCGIGRIVCIYINEISIYLPVELVYITDIFPSMS